MNEYQRLWWEQARSDHRVFLLLDQPGVSPCHPLHYLQMATEKLGKAYFWRSGVAPASSHVSFSRFLQALASRRGEGYGLIPSCLGFKHPDGLRRWVETVAPLAHEVERLAPSLAGDGPNPEYPWPRGAPTHAPTLHRFGVWDRMTRQSQGRQFLRVLDAAIARFPDYAA